MSARFDQTDLRVQNLFLKRRDFVQTFCVEAAQGVRAAARNSRVGTRNIQKDEVETCRFKRGMHGVRFGGFHGFQSQTREVFAHRFEPRGGAVGGGEFRISSARVEQHHRLSARRGAGVENASADCRTAERNAHRRCGILNVNCAVSERIGSEEFFGIGTFEEAESVRKIKFRRHAFREFGGKLP